MARSSSVGSAVVVALCLVAVLATPAAQLGWDAVAAAMAGSLPVDSLGPLFVNFLPAATVTLVPVAVATTLQARPSPSTVAGLVFGASLILTTLLQWATMG